MRQIKFRVWVERYSEFKYWGFVQTGIFTGIPSGSGLSIEYCKDNSQQFTGLLDKKGREIYEGDIISCQTSNKFKYPHCGVVIFLEHTAGFAITTESIVDDQGHEQEACTFFNYCENFEIIGNIHENPDLLKRNSS